MEVMTIFYRMVRGNLTEGGLSRDLSEAGAQPGKDGKSWKTRKHLLYCTSRLVIKLQELRESSVGMRIDKHRIEGRAQK